MEPIFFDTEVYKNFFLLNLSNGMRFSIYGETGTLRDDEIASIKHIFSTSLVVSFNGIGYDVPVICAALCGYRAYQIKMVSDQIIVEKVKPWNLDLPKWAPSNHIDIMEVAPGVGGLKQYGARIHSKKIQDLPIDPNNILTAEEIDGIIKYCDNDIALLRDLWNALQPQIEQRVHLSDKYGIDLRSKSDAQVAEAVLKHRCEQSLGYRITKPQINSFNRFKYDIPDFISFKDPQLIAILDSLKECYFSLGANGQLEMPYALSNKTITLGSKSYKMGIGGLHSVDGVRSVYSTATYQLWDHDVASYYPTLIINSGKYPSAFGKIFVEEYIAIVNERLQAKSTQGKLKKAGDTKSKEYLQARAGNEGGKIMINGTFGKTGSPYSILFAPAMTIQTTVTGQLALLMLIEWHHLNGIEVISANTDGIMVYCSNEQSILSKDLISEWEKVTGLTIESAQYRSIHMRDVNNYIAIKSDGEAKRKGEFAKTDLVMKKNPDCEICSDAVTEYLVNGIPLEYTISYCTDIRKFVTQQKVDGGGIKMWGKGSDKNALVKDMTPVLESCGWSKSGRLWIKDGLAPIPASEAYTRCFRPQVPQYLGKIVRWYYGKNSPGPIVYKKSGNTVAKSEGAAPCMELPDRFPFDVDYDWYINEAYKMLNNIGVTHGSTFAERI